MSNDRTATLIGSSAIFLWGILALLTTQTGSIPPFLLTALAFSIATGMAICKWLWHRESPLGYFKQPLKVWIVGVGGLFGYHLFYFMALKNAPPVDASLIAYLWPVLIVLFSALLPGERLRWFSFSGCFCRAFRLHPIGDQWRRDQFQSRIRAGLFERLGLRVYLVDLFGVESQIRQGANRCCWWLLRGYRHTRFRLPSLV